eukprot:UN30773
MLTGGRSGTEDDFKLCVEKFVTHPVDILEKDLHVVIDSVEKFPGVVGDMFVKLQYKEFNDSSRLTCVPGRNPLGLEGKTPTLETIFYDSSEFMMVHPLVRPFELFVKRLCDSYTKMTDVWVHTSDTTDDVSCLILCVNCSCLVLFLPIMICFALPVVICMFPFMICIFIVMMFLSLVKVYVYVRLIP